MIRLSRYVDGLIILVAIASVIFFAISYLRPFGHTNLTNINHNPKNDVKNQNQNLARTNAEAESVPNYNWRNFSEEQTGRLSVLGKWMLSAEGTNPPKPLEGDSAKEYLILVWKYGPMLERRHLKHFSSEQFSPWDNCSVNNCRLSYESSDAQEADAILFHLHRTTGLDELPKDLKFEKRAKQRWVFLTDESPHHTFLGGKQQLSNYNGLFNWSMTYRMDSDVPVPYGRTVVLKNPFEKNPADLLGEIMKAKTKLVAIMGSNCSGKNHRWDYVKRLEDILGDKLYIYGGCLGGDTKSCPGHFTRDCAPLGTYKFYLAFENSNCREYLTEKPFWHGYEKHSVPVIMGATRDDCRQLLPPKSYIHVEDFANPNTLADYLLYLDQNDEEYLAFHEWRRAFKVLNEHGYFQSTSRHYCRLCEALNYNQPSARVYDDLQDFWSVDKDCR